MIRENSVAMTILLLGAGAEATTFKTLYSFSGADGKYPQAGLIADASGNLYGTTSFGGAFGAGGTIFRLDAGGTLTTLHSFSLRGIEGYEPTAGLVSDPSGNLYGTTSFGGAFGSPFGSGGTIFRLDAGGTLTTLHSFGGSDGAAGNLISDANGNLYGTRRGSQSSGGSIFRLDTGGTFTTLHTFKGGIDVISGSPIGGIDGAFPSKQLLLDVRGNLYGTTRAGGTFGFGTIFRLDSFGRLTSLYNFRSWQERGGTSLVSDASGNLYGTTLFGGVFNQGTIFRLDARGTFSTLHSFSGSDGCNPWSPLIVDASGNLYGTTAFGDCNAGTVFRLDAGGNLTTLHRFFSRQGRGPQGPLLLDNSGNLYGMTESGGAFNGGIIFRLRADGPAVIPEPASWAMLIAGFGLVGVSLRARRRDEKQQLRG